jgi:hypothetical protein
VFHYRQHYRQHSLQEFDFDEKCCQSYAKKKKKLKKKVNSRTFSKANSLQIIYFQLRNEKLKERKKE